MNWEIYIDSGQNLCQVAASAVSAEDGKNYTVYQELKSPYRFFIMSDEKFRQEFKRHEMKGHEIEKHEIEKQEFIKQEPKAQEAGKNAQAPPAELEDLMLFLEAETASAKLNALDEIKARMTEHTIGSIEASLELPAGAGDIDSRIYAVKKTLLTHEKYEGRRLF